jgi:predicted component of type VI protein secretion system
MTYNHGRFGLLALILSAVISAPVFAQEIRDEKQCLQVMKDTAEAIDENPAIEGKAEAILLQVMELAKQRCEQKQFDNAKDLLMLARTMVAAE